MWVCFIFHFCIFNCLTASTKLDKNNPAYSINPSIHPFSQSLNLPSINSTLSSISPFSLLTSQAVNQPIHQLVSQSTSQSIRRAGAADQEHLLSSAKLNTTEHSHHTDRQHLCLRLFSPPPPPFSGVKFSVHSTNVFQNEVINSGPLYIYGCEKISYTR